MDAGQTALPSVPGKLGRRTYVVDRGFQLKYTVMLAVAGGIISAVFGSLMYLAHIEARRAVGTYSNLVPSVYLKTQLSQGEATMLWLVAGVTVMMAAVLGLFGILITHRVAGPIHVMSRYIGVLAEGRFPKMRPLRKGDELKSFFERFHSAIETLRQREAEEAAKIADALKVLAPLAAGAEPQAAIESLRALQQKKRAAADPVTAKNATIPPVG
jgi:methyl-accepting chemotaxis protein